MNAVQIDWKQLQQLALFLRNSSEVKSFNFCDEELFPSAGDPQAIDFFFYSTLHQFGFWHDDGKKYLKPMVGTIAGKLYKGSDFFWKATMRAKVEEPNFFKTDFRTKLKLKDFAYFYREDSTTCTLPMLKTHWQLALRCARDLLKYKLTPQKILDYSNSAKKPLETFLKVAGSISGYKEDPLKKKLMLLAVILAERPEKFLKTGKSVKWLPIVDYHVQRTALRTGLVEIVDENLREKITTRKMLSKEEERLVRYKVFEALMELQRSSGKSAAAIDWLFFSARKYCPEMTEPDCPRCLLNLVCVKRKELFQPVFRTTFY